VQQSKLIVWEYFEGKQTRRVLTTLSLKTHH